MNEWIIIVMWVLIGYACWDIFKLIMINAYNKRKGKNNINKEIKDKV